MSQRRAAVGSALNLLSFQLECEETRAWLLSKTRVVESTRELGHDLAGVLATQRKLYGIERELTAAESRLDALRPQADLLAQERPELAEDTAGRLAGAQDAMDGLQGALRDRAAALGEVGQLQSFLQDLDDFQAWLFRAQKAVAATEEGPTSLGEHAAAHEDAEGHAAAFTALLEAGKRVTSNQEDPEYEQLRERLRGVEAGWGALHKMWDARQCFLAQCLGFQEFLRDAKQAEILLANQVGEGCGYV